MALCADPLDLYCCNPVLSDGGVCRSCVEERALRAAAAEEYDRNVELVADLLPPQQARAYRLLAASADWMMGEQVRIGISTTMRGGGAVLQRLLEKQLVQLRTPPNARRGPGNAMEYEWKAVVSHG